MEKKKPTDEHDEGNSANGDVEIAPTHVIGFGAAWSRRELA